jgi:hypothetical protein
MLSVSDCVAGCIRLAIPQPAEWQRIGNQINAAMIFAGANFVNVCCRRGHGESGRIFESPAGSISMLFGGSAGFIKARAELRDPGCRHR